MSNYHMGMDGFVWFTAVVEDRNDPAKLGRVRIRCLGLHTEDKIEIPTESLPWAHVMHPIHDPSMQGMGTTPSFLVEGTWVIGFFRDATEMQQPVVMGTLPGYAGEIADTTKGFCDPSGTYPQNPNPKSGHDLGESDVNRLARGDGNYIHRILEEKQAASEEFSEIETAQSGNFNMPYENSTNFTQYPYNHVFESESGHVREYDDTTNEERIQEYHRAGTYYEIDAGGNRVVHVVGDNYEFIAGSDFINVKGDVNLTIDGNAETYVKEDYNIRCKNLNIEVEENFDTFVKGDTTQRYEKILKTTVLGAASQRYNDTSDFVFKGNVTETLGGTYDLSITGAVREVYGSTINRSILGLQTDIHAANYNLGATSGNNILIDAAEINLNNGSKGVARLDDVADTGDEGTGGETDANSAGTNKIESASTSVKAGTGGNPVDESDLVLTEIPDEDVPVDERTNTQGSENTEESGTGGYNPPPEGGGVPIPAIPVRPTKEEISSEVETAGIDTTNLSVAQQRQAHKDTVTDTLAKYYPDQYEPDDPKGQEQINLGNDPTSFESGEKLPPITAGSDASNQNQYRSYLGVPTAGKKFGDIFDESEITDDIRKRYSNKYFPSDYSVVQLRGRPRLKIKLNAGVTMTGLKSQIIAIAEKVAFDMGKQLTINSAYRSSSANKGVGGAKSSRHMFGEAMDIRVQEMTKKERIQFVDSAASHGALAFGFYGRFIHMDIYKKRNWGSIPSYLIPTLRKYKISPYKNG